MLRSYLLFLLAVVIWGGGFINVKVLGQIGPTLWWTQIRFILSGLLPLALLLSPSPTSSDFRHYVRQQAIPLLFCSLNLYGLLLFQAWGLAHTSVANSSFITSLYVLFIPLYYSMMKHCQLSWRYWGWVIMALGGIALLIQGPWETLNVGDGLTLLSALCVAGHVITCNAHPKALASPWWFNLGQLLYLGFYALIFLCVDTLIHSSTWSILGEFYEERWNLLIQTPVAWWSLFHLVILSSMVAFYCQARAQQQLSPTVVSILYLLESPLAILFAYIFLSEVISLTQFTGCLLVLGSAFGVSLSSTQKSC